MTVMTLQASLLSKPYISSLPFFSSPSNSLSHRLLLLRHCRFLSSSLPPLPCTLRPDNVGFDSERKELELDAVLGWEGLGEGEVGKEESGKEEEEEEERELRKSVERGERVNEFSELPVVVFLVGLWATARRGLERFFASGLDWFGGWVPFWVKEKRLERLIAEADANPKDPEKHSALLAELNKHSPESVIKRFEQRDHAVDSRGVAEYLRALVITNGIADYLPNGQSGKASSLPALLQELKQCASGDTDEVLVSPGISEKRPLHVVMVDPKVSNKSRFAQELISTILFTVAVGLVDIGCGRSSKVCREPGRHWNFWSWFKLFLFFKRVE